MFIFIIFNSKVLNKKLNGSNVRESHPIIELLAYLWESNPPVRSTPGLKSGS